MRPSDSFEDPPFKCAGTRVNLRRAFGHSPARKGSGPLATIPAVAASGSRTDSSWFVTRSRPQPGRDLARKKRRRLAWLVWGSPTATVIPPAATWSSLLTTFAGEKERSGLVDLAACWADGSRLFLARSAMQSAWA